MSARARSHGGTRQLFAIGVAILAMLMMGLVQPAGAQADPASCGHYGSQASAQEDLEAHPEYAISLDSDGNGVACEGVFDQGPPPVFDPVSCGFFETQEDAQEALDARPEDAASLDPDGNGIACEGVFETGPSVVVFCNTALGTLVEISKEAVDRGDFALDFPSRLATEAEIAAGTCAVTPEVPRAPTVVICDQSRGRLLEVSPEMLERGTRSFPSRLATEAEIAADECPVTAPEKPGDDGKPGTGMVTNLPSTGTGGSEAQGQHAPLVAVAVPLALILTGLALQLRNRRPLA